MRIKLIEDIDSNGNDLTPEQEKFFKGSRIRDRSGKLLVCYRNTVDKDRSGFGGIIKWFTAEESYADKYNICGNNITYKCYLNCKNIFDCGNTDGRIYNLNPARLSLTKEFLNLLNKLDLTEQLFVKIFKDEITSPEAYKLKIFSIVRTDKFANLVKRSGYDCIKTFEEGNLCYGVFNNNDIKLITNKNPTKSSNINESK